jgi:hypothetical protein
MVFVEAAARAEQSRFFESGHWADPGCDRMYAVTVGRDALTY